MGALLYISVCTRPDVAYAVMNLTRYLHCHQEEHYDAALRVLRYLKTTENLGLVFTKQTAGEMNIVLFSDADLGGDHSFRSTSGYVIFVNDTPVAWHSGLQSTIAQSTFESEYVALNQGIKDSYFVKYMMDDVRRVESMIVVRTDSEKLVQSLHSGNIINSKKVRHLNLKAHWIMERMEVKQVVVGHVRGLENPADIFTKALPKPAFVNHREKLVRS